MTTVLIDGYALSDGSELRGIGTYLKRVVAGLGRRPELSVKLLADAGAPVPEGAVLAPMHWHGPGRFRSLEHDLRLPAQLKRHASDVFLSPAQHPPRRSPVPWVQTLHDLIPVTRPHPVLARDRRRWLRIGPRLRRATAIVAVSRFSADEGIRHFGIDPRIVEVIPQGVDPAIFHPGEAVAQGGPYLLHVAAWGPHKGYQEALSVIARLAERGHPHRLALVGPQDDWMLAQVKRAVAASPRPDRVDIRGYVDDLPAVYRGATALLMTSRCEGFGLPALEAMACGTPVAAFANSSLPEVVGDGGVLVGDGDVEAMVEAVQRVIEDADTRSGLVERGLAQSARFRWEDTVAAYAELLSSAAR